VKRRRASGAQLTVPEPTCTSPANGAIGTFEGAELSAVDPTADGVMTVSSMASLRLAVVKTYRSDKVPTLQTLLDQRFDTVVRA
jgi:hypothetical protein